MDNMIEIRWHGRGGQGAKTASQLLADAAFMSGKYVQSFPEYGPERSGAPITAYNRISDEMKDDDLRAKDIQINELLENADVLLTDYSSVFYEFLLTNRPVGFLIGDINDYKRGFAMDNPLDEMPGAKISTYEDLISFIEESLNGQDNYADERRRIRDKVFKYQDGNNSYRLYKWMVRKANLEE